MIRFYSLRRPHGWFWSHGYRQEEIEASHRDGEIGGDWKICPDGVRESAMTVAEFLDNPDVFREEFQRIELARVEERTQTVARTPAAENREREEWEAAADQGAERAYPQQTRQQAARNLNCSLCGGSRFDWGWIGPRNAVFKSHSVRLIPRFALIGGQRISARKCCDCGNVLIFVKDLS